MVKENDTQLPGCRFKCFHNGIILIVNCFKNCSANIQKKPEFTKILLH